MTRSITPPYLLRCSLRLAVSGLALAALVGGLSSDASAKDKGDEVTFQFLDSTGEDDDAIAAATFTDNGEGEQHFVVGVVGLPEGTYDVFVNDLVTPKGSIVVDAEGLGDIEFATPQDGSKPLLDFTVLDQAIEIREGKTVFFSDTFSTDGTGTLGDGDKTKTEINLVNVNPEADFDARGSIKYTASTSKVKLTLKVARLDAGDYEIRVDGVPVSQFTTVDSGALALDFQDPVAGGTTQLGIDPLGKQVDIAQAGGDVLLSGVLPASNTATGVKAPSTAKKGSKDLGKTKADSLQVFLLNTGVLQGALGSATLSQDSAAVVLVVKIEDVPSGTYDVAVGGIDVGMIDVDSTGTGQIEFSSSPTGTKELLSFAVKGELIEVKSGEDTILRNFFFNSVQEALASFKQETFKSNKVKVNLINGGIDLDATGTVNWKLKGNGDQEVTVDVKDLPAGEYTLVVNGMPSATLLDVDDKGKTKLTWATVMKGKKVLLDFDPVDATLEVVDANDQALLRTVLDVP
jgi:hypothetical protein